MKAVILPRTWTSISEIWRPAHLTIDLWEWYWVDYKYFSISCYKRNTTVWHGQTFFCYRRANLKDEANMWAAIYTVTKMWSSWLGCMTGLSLTDVASCPAGALVGSVTTQISAIHLTKQGQPASASSSSPSPTSSSPLPTEECLIGETQLSGWEIDRFTSVYCSLNMLILSISPVIYCFQARVCYAGGWMWRGAAWWAGKCL